MNFVYLKEALDKLVTDGEAPGVDCSVYIEHKEVFRYFTGMNDVEENIKIAGNELYIIYSMTKMLTCVSALQLFEKGTYHMDDPLAKYISEFSDMLVTSEPYMGDDTATQTGQIVTKTLNSGSVYTARNPITIRHLFSMSAGFDYRLDEPAITEAIATGKTTTFDIAKSLAKTVLGFEPGTRYRYSLCHDVLGALVEIWSGMKLGDYMRANIFEPLDMQDTFFGVPEDKERRLRLAALYVRKNAGLYEKIPPICEFNLTKDYQSGGAGLISSTKDYALFLDALACQGLGKTGKRILSPSSIELMRCNQLKDKQLEDFELSRKGYGYGFGVRTHISPERSASKSPVGEFGWGGAAGAFSLVDPANKLSLTYFQHMRKWSLNLEKILRDALYKSIEE